VLWRGKGGTTLLGLEKGATLKGATTGDRLDSSFNLAGVLGGRREGAAAGTASLVTGKGFSSKLGAVVVGVDSALRLVSKNQIQSLTLESHPIPLHHQQPALHQ
jgi:hypothetical protein